MAPAITFNPLPTQMSQQVDDMFLEAPGSLGQVQRITFGYSISFTGTNDFSSVVVPIELTATIGGVSSNAEIDLTPVDAPYMDHGPISWLSNDARVFKLQPGEPFPGTSVTLGSDPNAFIQNVIGWLRGAASAQAYQTFEQLPSGEDAADLEWLPTLNNAPVYNFALCRVRYRATMTKAKDVRVFFRLFQTAATGTDYDPSTTYRVGGQPGVRMRSLEFKAANSSRFPSLPTRVTRRRRISICKRTRRISIRSSPPAAERKATCTSVAGSTSINRMTLASPFSRRLPTAGPSRASCCRSRISSAARINAW